jgi:hypothetical protein
MNLNANVMHLVTRTFGDEIVMTSLERKCMCIAQLNAHKDVLQMMAWRSCEGMGYIPTVQIQKFVWTFGLRMMTRPFTADVTDAVLRAPNVELTPNDYQN